MHKSDVINRLKERMTHDLNIFGNDRFSSDDAEITIYDDVLTIEYTGACGTEAAIRYEDIDRISYDDSSLHLSVSAPPISERLEVLFKMEITVGIEEEEA